MSLPYFSLKVKEKRGKSSIFLTGVITDRNLYKWYHSPDMAEPQTNLWKNLPTKPGIYMFKDATGKIIYVGKAINLKKRVSSYFAKTHHDRPWTAVLVGLIDSIETIVVTSELEALMLEATLIKQHLPRFNIKLTDDKSYPYIKLITDEAIPRFTVTRRQSGDKHTYFGPYLSARAANYALEFLRKLYGIHISPRPLAHRDRPCLNCQLDEFTCPQAGELDKETYQKRIDQAVDFLLGKRKNLINDLEERMTIASNSEQFEVAARLRDQWQSIKQVTERQQVISTTIDDYDVIGTAKSSTLATVSVLQIREGRLVSQKGFFFAIVGDEQPADIVRTFLLTFYRNFSDIPKLVAISESINDQSALQDLIQTSASKIVELRVAERGEKRQLVELANKNAQAKLESKLLTTDHAFTNLIALKEVLKLDYLPSRIEAVDISNLGTSEPVGATVCFIDGQPDKNEYRRYKIKTVEGQNDFAMIGEVVLRRFSDTSRPAPDLFMVDGGPEQLKFALSALEKSPIQPKQIISLAKKPDRIFLPGAKRPVRVSKNNKGLLLLSRVRDEVHRFGITFQRHRQRRKSLEG